MGAFGADTVKPSCLYCNDPVVKRLSRAMTQEQKHRLACLAPKDVAKKDAFGGVSGGADLKETQAYTKEYGEQVLVTYLQWKRQAQTIVDEGIVDERIVDAEQAQTDVHWKDAGLHEVCDWLGLPSDHLIA